MNAVVDAPPDLAWFGEQAEALDRGNLDSGLLFAELARRHLFGIGVPVALGGSGGSVAEAMEAIARVAERSLAAALTFWGHRTFIEYLLQSPNAALRERWLPALLSGAVAGATGLSNAMKYLSGIESVQIAARPLPGDRLQLRGRLPWVTNLQPAGFIVAVAADRDGAPPAIVALHDRLTGVRRGPDLDLIALRGTATAMIDVDDADIGAAEILHEDANGFCPQVRPAFLALQLGLSIGLARASLAQVRAQQTVAANDLLVPQAKCLADEIDTLAAELRAGLASRRFTADAPGLFGIRIRLAELVRSALDLELAATGGRAYLEDTARGFARRWREGAFIPVITPSLTQLRGELYRAAAG